MVYIPPQYTNLIINAAQQLNLPVALVAAQINLESSWDPTAESKSGALGLAQFEPDTWAEYGTSNPDDRTDPVKAINAYVNYMKYLLQIEGGNVQLALAAYNAGPGNITAGQQYADRVISMSQLAPSQYMSTDNNGVSLFNSNVSNYVANNTPVLSMAALQSQYPLVAALISSVPELEDKFKQAIAEQWSTDRFIAAVQNTTWWATHSNTARQVFALMKSDPATYQQNITNLYASIQQMSAQLGASMTQAQLHQFATDALFGGYDQNQAVLNQKFAEFVKPTSGNHFGGQAGTYEDQIRQGMRDLGVFIPEDQLDTQIQQIIGGQSSVQSVLSQLRTQAASMYPAYASQINSGMNVSDIASPYIGRAQQLLEQGPGSMNIQTPLIKQALQYTLDGKPTSMPMYDFEKQVRQDPRWLQTDNAQDSFMSNAHKVLTDFGFAY